MANQGVPFSQNDREQLRAKGLYSFGVNGELIKSVYLLDSNTPQLQEWTLTIEDKTARWVKGPRREALRLLGMFDPHYIESVGGRYAVQEESDGALRAYASGEVPAPSGFVVPKEFEGPVRVYDKLLSKRLDDPWLDAVLSDYLFRDELKHTQVVLADDLKYLVVKLHAWNGHEDFTYDGKSYALEGHCLVYTRPDKHPAVFSTPPGDCQLIEVEGKPYTFDQSSHGPGAAAFEKDKDKVRLRALDGHVVLTHQYTDDEKWLAKSLGPAIRDDPEHKRTLLYDIGISNSLPLNLAIWNYWSPVISVYGTNIGELFELKRDGYYPKDVTPIESPDQKK